MKPGKKYNIVRGRVHSPRWTFAKKFQKYRLAEGRRGLGRGRGIAAYFRCRILATRSAPGHTLPE